MTSTETTLSGTLDAQPAPGDRRRWFALAIVMTAAFMDLVDVTIVNIAIPSIRQDSGASVSQIQWITAGYALAFAAGLITGGRLGDIHGRKRLFLVGIGGFTLASALCGFAANPEMLVAARILQGGMAAMMVPQVLSIVHATFPAHERGKVFGLFGAVVGLGAVSGPLLGALLTEWNLFGLQWRPIFLINLPVGIMGLVLGSRFITESKAPRALKLDLVGVAMVVLGLLMLLYPLTRGEELDWPVWGYVSMAGAPLVFAALVAYEKRKGERDGSPLVELSLFKVKSFAAGIAVQTVFGVGLGIFFLVWTLYMQTGLGWSPLRAGLTGVPFSIAVSTAAGLSVQKLVPRFGRGVLQAGALLMAVGVLLYLWEAERYGMSISSWQMALPLVVMGAGMGLIVAPLTDAVLSEVPREHAGSASGLINTVQQMGNALGLGLVSVVFFGVIGDDLRPAQVGPAFVDAFQHALGWVAAVMVVIFLLMFALPKRPAQHVEGAAGLPVAEEKEPELVS
ncbi:EmrB/QacA subfamily drug resistance transporter [Streptomyces sp. SAI-135]|uniref:MFS transporter n=1 Tax=unclassified Streptomyces TaxID=2593676 RepID=UPI002476ADCA|nr:MULTISPECIES: MFS transporter [unclassified Streptomyces]MDH6518446.1 EmrB/QacA subfamily drug resistance transporter [Streptomyces sp. SAI-090]MDH6550664.1 EmrB/QacA subfamily drug resistance transporter [Streptomyces sp. SAI-041]MDH6569727.1 EmrB/QacA subfamily drug resistance transporter [Streptomyces sp. SAI-117]MDH6585316.1 EmrB/QacA subfamily drug resistance transporter [Streptomyces sp. SAI-133]MDH6617462.1 EmrB/QacA subfamily drug resistance transporter [Streptomyces sp. SAI-135]